MMRHSGRLLLLLLLSPLIHAGAARAQNPTKAQVQQAIDQGVRYLKKQQQADGRWRLSRQYQQGSTALCVYALLMAGVPRADQAVQRGIRYMLSQKLAYTYCVSLVSLALTEADAGKYKAEITRCARWLESAQSASGVWGYLSSGGRAAGGDNSNTQFAVLGLWAAERAGVKVDARVWQKIRDHFEKTQAADGSWGYRPREGAKLAMTLAGIGSLLIARGRLRKPGRT